MAAADPVQAILAALGKRKAAAPAPAEKRKLSHTFPWYAKRYGKSLRTVKRWAADGIDLDDAAAVAEHMAAPDRQAGRKAAEMDPTPAPAAAAPAPAAIDPEADAIAVQLGADFHDGAGVLAAIERLKKAEQERGAAYVHAIARNHGAQTIANRLKEWTSLIEALRKLEKDVPDIRRANDTAIDKAETMAALGQTFQAFKAAGNNMPGRAARKVVGLTDYDEVVEILEKEWATVCRSLVDITLSAVDRQRQAQELAEQQARASQAERREQEAAADAA